MSGWPPTNLPEPQQLAQAGQSTLWLKCTTQGCGEGSVKLKDGAIYPPAAFGPKIGGLPPAVARAWDETGIAYGVGAYTAAEMMCRKLLMHIAVEAAKSVEHKHFAEYVKDLDKAGLIVAGHRAVVDQVKDRGNIANHELAASTQDEARVTLMFTQHLLISVYEIPDLVPRPTLTETEPAG
jgi:hypothetical protein